MKLEEQVCSLELAKKLKELGVKQESLFVWAGNPRKELGVFLHDALGLSDERYAAFTVAELGEMLGTELTDANESDSFTLKCGNAIDFWWAAFGNDEINITPQFENVKFADALAEMLIYLIENKLFTL